MMWVVSPDLIAEEQADDSAARPGSAARPARATRRQHDPAAGHRPVGMVGTGNMGGRMTRRMVEAGHAVLAVDADPARIPACGATQANSLAELAERCDVIMLSLPDSPVIEAVIRNPGGLLEHARDGQVIVDLSTANPASTRALHDELAGRGVRYLDAGISGGAAGAEKGTLTLMVGGDETALAQVKPLLDTFSAHVHHMGGSGTGHVTKVLNNFLNGVTLAATAEVMVAGKKAGLDLAQLLDVINTSTGVSFASLNRFPHIIKGDYLEGGLTGRLMAKDVRLYLDLAEELGVVTLVGPGTLAAFQVSNALGYGTMISNRVVDAVGDLAGGIRVPEQEHRSRSRRTEAHAGQPRKVRPAVRAAHRHVHRDGAHGPGAERSRRHDQHGDLHPGRPHPLAPSPRRPAARRHRGPRHRGHPGRRHTGRDQRRRRLGRAGGGALARRLR